MQVTTDEMKAILAGLAPSKLNPDGVRAALEGTTLEPVSLGKHLFFEKGRYTRNLVHRNDDFEILVLCWDEGTYSPIHNHSGQDCWLLVQEGQFCLEGYVIKEGGTCPGSAILEHVESSHKVNPGVMDHRGPIADIHRVTVSRGNPRAISIHVYAKPFDECLVYDLKGGKCQKQRLKYFSIDGKRVD